MPCPPMRCEVVAVGTELLLGDVLDTNSAWLGGRLARAGIDCHFQTRVGDNVDRVASALGVALGRSEAVVVCGGLGPTHDDVTREALAALRGVQLEEDEALLRHLGAVFASRGRRLDSANRRQAQLPRGAEPIPPAEGTAPGLICPIGDHVVYAVPGVPSEMREMVDRAVLPHMSQRFGVRATIVSRSLRTWGMPESALAEALAPRIAALDARAGDLTMAFLAREGQGVEVRLTAKAAEHEAARSLLDAEEAEVRALLGQVVFGVDVQTMEQVVGELLAKRGLYLAVAESLTGGLVSSNLVTVEGASSWYRGAIVSYDPEVKFDVLGVGRGPVVTEQAAAAMADGVMKVLHADVGVSLTGVAGPEEREGMPVGTVFVGVSLDGDTEVTRLRLNGNRERIRRTAAISSLDFLRQRLLSSGP
jgi:nicotinamide-nucleotide amidase